MTKISTVEKRFAFHFVLMYLGNASMLLLSPSNGQILELTKPFSLGLVTILGEGKL